MTKEFILPEFMAKHKEKKAMENEYFGGYEEFLQEKTWEKRSSEAIREIEKVVDEGLEQIVSTQLEPPGESRTTRELIYSSKRGYIVKLTCNENGKTRVGYYLVTKIEDIEEAIDRISSYWPLIENGEGEKLFGL